MESRLYSGWVTHRRTALAENRFRYPVYYLALDLDELPGVDSALRLFSHNRPNLVSFWDSDHGPRDGSPLRPWIDGLVERAGIDLSGGRVILLTFPRVLGFRFYPVSFWYCFSADGIARAVLAEVQNTYRDHHNYLLHAHGAPFDWGSRPTAVKAFYVSPFIPRDDACYEFAFSPPDTRLAVTIRDFVGDTLTLTASIDLTARELTDRALLGTVLSHGPGSAVALLRIHWQALKLIAKRVPLYRHTSPPTEETSL
jgi:DUF1365 family protein